ncbi:hypothetical protein QJS10_CPA10g01739 [Acorus calamus]|uniref:Uncharacterized protein n=1 Tax=Acorus calamus TaxID=4465 RepID=A0AAV9E127_ACOCL|nr:hypothetical protein QJS10_CPA10g01739 [Acorus calamus]
MAEKRCSSSAEKDTAKGMGAGWERFDFNKDAPLDDEEIEVAEDDALLVKNMGHSFRFSALETKREEEVKAAHDQAMFGGSTALSGNSETESIHEDATQEEDAQPGKTLVSDKVLSIQQGSWRDRVRRLHDGSKIEMLEEAMDEYLPSVQESAVDLRRSNASELWPL